MGSTTGKLFYERQTQPQFIVVDSRFFLDFTHVAGPSQHPFIALLEHERLELSLVGWIFPHAYNLAFGGPQHLLSQREHQQQSTIQCTYGLAVRPTAAGSPAETEQP